MPKRSYHRILDEHLHILISQGNHEAYQRLKKRYKYHGMNLCHDILAQYVKTGISSRELSNICNGSFLSIVANYDPSLSSFFSHWKENTVHRIMEYMVDNAYIADIDGLAKHVALDEGINEKCRLSDVFCESDDDRTRKRKAFELKSFITRNEDTFIGAESTILKFVLDGYSLADLEHTGLMSRSKLYLTFNSAVDKLKTLLAKFRRNKH